MLSSPIGFLGRAFVGAILLNDDALGLSAGGIVLVKQVALNLLWRFT